MKITFHFVNYRCASQHHYPHHQLKRAIAVKRQHLVVSLRTLAIAQNLVDTNYLHLR
ncbi:MAG: hypothetical protein KME01_03660 [Chroococcus sp. CMT-3BRIN-NPC107]|jgi:hypothetical protein|nr:hypothetical protein [Chroococcus sp. CMT-3BRIN-NPC107]